MGRLILRFVCVYILLLCSFLLYLSRAAEAGENWFIQPDEVSVQYKSYHQSARHPLFVNSRLKEGIDLTMNTDFLFETLFWDNLIHTNTDDSQYRHIGWQFRLGTRVTSFLSVQYEHHSQHLLDSAYPHMKFPVEDSLGFTLTIYQARPRGSSLLGI
jgi:hypothetical protein